MWQDFPNNVNDFLAFISPKEVPVVEMTMSEFWDALNNSSDEQIKITETIPFVLRNGIWHSISIKTD